jgi:hypothetical protein
MLPPPPPGFYTHPSESRSLRLGDAGFVPQLPPNAPVAPFYSGNPSTDALSNWRHRTKANRAHGEPNSIIIINTNNNNNNGNNNNINNNNTRDNDKHVIKTCQSKANIAHGKPDLTIMAIIKLRWFTQ